MLFSLTVLGIKLLKKCAGVVV